MLSCGRERLDNASRIQKLKSDAVGRLMLETKADTIEIPEYLHEKLEGVIEQAKRQCFRPGASTSGHEDANNLHDSTWCLSVMQQLKVTDGGDRGEGSFRKCSLCI